jgi:hypothetical protein
MRDLRALCVIVFALCLSTIAQQAIANRNVNLREDPSTDNDPIRLVEKGEQFKLLDPDKVNGYYRVRTSQGEEGWVWGSNIRISAEEPAFSPQAPEASSINPQWEKPTPTLAVFSGTEGDCPPEGDGGSPEFIRWKNRSDTPDSYHPVKWEAIATLQYPDGPKNWGKWTKADAIAAIKKYNGIPVSTTGYVVAAKVQTGDGEICNCHFGKRGNVDWHVALTKHEGDGEEDAVVVEPTPRFFAQHPGWDRLKDYVDTSTLVRVSGFLMFDSEHRNHLHRYRTTLWEIHPITKLEVFQSGQWVNLDNLQ